jgi:hypothetical protein
MHNELRSMLFILLFDLGENLVVSCWSRFERDDELNSLAVVAGELGGKLTCDFP